MEAPNSKKKILVTSIIHFLQKESAQYDVTSEAKESIDVAIQCLETAYEIETTDTPDKIDLLKLVKTKEEVVPEEKIRESETHKVNGNVAMRSENFDDAVTHYTRAIEANPNNAVYFCNRAAAFSRLQRHDMAILDCQQALLLDPNYGKAYGRLGVAYSNLDMWEKAVEAYEMALKIDADNLTYGENLRIAKTKLVKSKGNSASGDAAPIELAPFINNENLIHVAREMISHPNFQDIMSNVLTMGQSGGTNFETIFQAGQSLAQRLQQQDPIFLDDLHRRFDECKKREDDPPQ